MSVSLKLRTGTSIQFETAKSAAILEPNSLYLIDGSLHLSLSESTDFAFVDYQTVSQMIAGLSSNGEGGVTFGTQSGKPPTESGTTGESLYAAREDHTHGAQTDITGNAKTADTAQSANKLTNPQSIRLTGAITGIAQFSGDADCTIATTLNLELPGPTLWTGIESEVPIVRDENTIYFIYE